MNIIDIERTKLYKEQNILLEIQTKYNINLAEFSYDNSNLKENENTTLFRKYYLYLKHLQKKLQEFINDERRKDEDPLDISKLKDNFIDINIELKFRTNKLIIINEVLRNHYQSIEDRLQELEKKIQINKNSTDYEKSFLIINENGQINDTISRLKEIQISIASAIKISEELAIQYKTLSENYDKNKIIYLLDDIDKYEAEKDTNSINITEKMISTRFARLERRINELYLASSNLYKISSSRETGFNELKKLKERFYIDYYNIIKTLQFNKYQEFEDDIINELSIIEYKVEEYIYDTRSIAKETIMNLIEKIYNSNNYKDFLNIDTEIKNINNIEELLKIYSSYLKEKEKKELQKQVISLKFNLLYRKQIELFIYRNEKNECSFVKDNLTNLEKQWFKIFLQQKLKNLKNKHLIIEKNKKEDLFETPIDQILYNKDLLEKLIIMDIKYNPYYYINLLKAKIFNAHLCNIADNPFKKERHYVFDPPYYKEISPPDKVNYSLLLAILRSIITDEDISIIECNNIYRRFGFKCNLIMFYPEQECIKELFEQVKWTNEYFKISDALIKKNMKKLEIPYCKIKLIGVNYFFDDEIATRTSCITQEIDTAILLINKLIKRNKNSILYNRTELYNTELKLKKLAKRKTRKINNIILYNDSTLSLRMLQEDRQEITNNINKYTNNIISLRAKKQLLIDIKTKRKNLEQEEKALRIISYSYNYSYEWSSWLINKGRYILPLENMHEPFPDEKLIFRWRDKIRDENWYRMQDIIYNNLLHYMTSLSKLALWEKYKEECNELGIEVYSKEIVVEYCGYSDFDIYLNLNNILELPIDYRKVELLTNDELEELMTRKEFNPEIGKKYYKQK